MTTKKLMNYSREAATDLAWLVDHGFGSNATDANNRAVILARRVLECVA